MRHQFILLTTLFFSLTISLNANTTREKRITQMHEKKWHFLVKNANLSTHEQKKVKPLFLQHEKALWEYHKAIRRLFRKGQKKELDDKAYRSINDKRVALQVAIGTLSTTYHEQLQQQLSPSKLFRYYRAEQLYQRHLLQKRGRKGGGGVK